MLVFWEQRLVILATPKTGSTALAEALGARADLAVLRPPVLKHTTVHRYRRFVGPYLEAASKQSFTVVALMREPRDWLGSWFRFRQRDDQADVAKRTRGMSFDRFVSAYCDSPQPDFSAVGSQGRFLRPRQGVGADRLFRYEAMDEFLEFLEHRLGQPVVLPRVNVSPVTGLDLSPENERRLAAVLSEDFALYASIAGV